jgi:enoyl-CoA hydratase/carnithine racemase
MSDYAYETVLVEVADSGATRTQNRPQARKPVDLTKDREFQQAHRGLDADEDVRAIVVTGAGRAFCGGVDLQGGAASAFGDEAHEAHDSEFGITSDQIAERSSFWRMRTPLIGAINGAAVGAGLTITMLFDVRFVAEEAKLGFVFTRRGIIPDANVTWLLSRIAGTSRALDLLMSGRMFNGKDAVEYGLALKATPADQVLETALAYARDIAANTSPTTVAATKALVYRFLQETDRDAAMALETKLIWWAGSQPDAVEGVMSFLEKRTPAWKGSKLEDLPEPVWPTGR